MQTLATVALVGGFALVVFGLAKLAFVPLAIAYEAHAMLRRRRSRRTPAGKGRHHGAKGSTLLDHEPFVSVIVPAYNEGPVLANCVRSILASDYDQLQVLIVDDGSKDETFEIAQGLADADSRVVAIRQDNAGKGAALNRGIAEATGDVYLFVDADGIFAHETISMMLAALTDSSVGAVCGDDRPVNLDRSQTHLLAILNHAGTGLVRRALHLLGCLPIVSGNIGAFPAAVIDEIGGFDTSTVGEDLELTWRVHRAGYRVAFAPRALVYAEAPSTIANLWKQRVRWARGLLQTMRIHWRMVGNPRYGTFGIYLIVNTLTMIVAPVLQLVVLLCVPFAVASGRLHLTATGLSILGWLGLGVSLAVVVTAVLLNQALRDLRFAWTLLLWPLYSTGMAAVVVTAIFQELRGGPANWNKMTRTGVVSASGARALTGGTDA